MTFETGGLYGINVIRAGVSYSLHTQDGPYIRVDETGWDITKARRLKDRGPLQHGVTDIGFRLEERSATLVFDIIAEDEISFYEAQDFLFDLFKPADDPLQVQFLRPDGKVKQIEVQCLGNSATSPRKGTVRRVGFELYAPDPTFYDPTQHSFSFGISAGGGSLLVPVAVPLSVGSSTIGQTTSIHYDGNWITYPEVLISGPISNPVVTNNTTGEKLDLTGTTLLVGQIWTIDCRFDYKTVIDQDGVNKIASLTNDSDLATFHLEPHPGALGGDNSITVTGGGATSATQVYIRYYDRYSHR